MSELEDLVAIHGAVDREVQREPDLVESIAPLLTSYGVPGTAGWFEEFERWSDAVAPGATLPDLDLALNDLAERAPRPRMAARRLLAIGALVRARPQLAEESSPQLLAALAVDGITARTNTEELLGRLAGPRFESIGQWEQFIRECVADGVLPETFIAQAGAPPCSGVVRPARTPTGRVVSAATLSTTMETDAVDFDCACRFLEPVNWPNCSDFWCTMEQVAVKPNGNPVFHEVVSLDCTSRGPVWRAEAYLEFGFSKTATVASATYQLDADRTVATDWIVVDEGWLKVAVDGPGIRVETVKTISFAGGLFHSPGQIAAMMCALGYGDAVGDLLFNCAIDCTPDSGTEFPSNVRDGGEG